MRIIIILPALMLVIGLVNGAGNMKNMKTLKLDINKCFIQKLNAKYRKQ